jgi:CO/xanthine dehydrogenase Mo-binding subunit
MTRSFIEKERDKAAGRARFAADIGLKSPLVLKVARSSEPHAKIRGIDVSRALEISGVAGVFTADSVPGRNSFGILKKDQPLLAAGKVRQVGEPVALVAAEDEAAARKALQAIEIAYEPLPAVFDPEKALKKDAPRIHKGGNLLSSHHIVKGDAQKALLKCSAVAKRTYRTPAVEHGCLEPDAGVGYMDKDGLMTLRASTQNPHYDRMEVAAILGIGEEKIRVIQAETGGAFGSRLDLTVQGHIALALWHLKRPVRLVYDRKEVFDATSKRHPFVIHMETGADERGKILAMRAKIICDTGAYCSYGMATALRAAIHAAGPYEIENVDAKALCVYTNRPFSGAMRGFGVPQAAFAHESQMDILAQTLSLDPLDIRRLNALKPGSKTATGQVLKNSVGIHECLDAIEPHYRAAQKKLSREKNAGAVQKGVGLGAMLYGIGNTGVKNPSRAEIRINAKGRVVLSTGCADIGQGSTGALARVAARVLGIRPDAIQMEVADTQTTPDAGATSASRQTYISGNAVKKAAEKLAGALKSRAAVLLNTPEKRLALCSGFICDPADPGKKISLDKAARSVRESRMPTRFSGHFEPGATSLCPKTGQGSPYAAYAYACQMAVVAVDTLTGKITVERIIAAHDVGKAICRKKVIGQICGGAVMGMGFALMEEFFPGRTRSMKDLHVPTCADAPEILPVIVESPEPTGPFGAKGVGEASMVPTAPAICNAIKNAAGKRALRLPATSERILKL